MSPFRKNLYLSSSDASNLTVQLFAASMRLDYPVNLFPTLDGKEQMTGFQAVLTKLVRLVTHISGQAVKNNISVAKLTHHGEFLSLSVNEGGFITIFATEVLTDEASLCYHKRNSAIGDKSAADISCLWQSKLGRENKVCNTHITVNLGALAIGNVQSEVTDWRNSKALCQLNLTYIAN